MAAQKSRKPKRARKRAAARKIAIIKSRADEAAMANIKAATATEAKYRGLVETAPDAIISVDREGRMVFVNSQTERMFGYSRDELLGKPVEMLVPERFRDRHVGHRTDYTSQPRTRLMGVWFDIRGRRKDGSDIPVDIALSPVEADGGLQITAIIRDISDRKRLEEQVQHNVERIQTLREIDQAITSTLDLRTILDILLEKIDHLLPFVTAATVRLLNRETGELEPVACRNLDEEEWKVATAATTASGLGRMLPEKNTPVMVLNVQTDPRSLAPEFLRKYGLVSSLRVPLVAKDEVLGALTLFTKEEHQFTDDEVEFLTTLAGQAAVAIHNSQLYEEMTKLAGDLAKSNRVKDEFLSVMSHELRTPLNVVMGFTGMIKDKMLGEINPEQERALEKVITHSDDLLKMISEILAATSIEAHAVKVEAKEVSLGSFLDDLRSTYETPLNKELTLQWNYSPALPTMRTDGEKLKHILENLINNAVKFTDHGKVTISARYNPKAKAVDFRVADTGIGIQKEILPSIFEMFRQADSSETRLYGGVGMGLYVAKKFTELLGGKIEVESERGKGSTFTVTIPCS